MNDSTISSTQGKATRADLITAGRKLFATSGFDGTSVRALTTEAGTNLGAITYHFGSKRTLYAAVLEDGLRPLARRVQAAAASDGTARQRMLAVIEAYFEHLAERPDVPRLMLQEVAAGKEPPAVIREIIGTVKETIAGLQDEGVADGSVRPGHPVLTALSIVSQPVYLTLVAPMLRSVGGIDLSDPVTRRMTVEHTLAFVDAALTPRAGA
ncbi:MAG: TetR/AcrR family transcriptional regulator [Gemmatimonadetes bacterium]|nr:TetR/AcrR family transcriptional regulator [Gemmatimonadota bacterium]NNF13130.1 TetR/AcrR family transcriptional regulator [Gemmatimonadota bacterium]NNL31038.1 TetR/AcrR family transcriptional regulator [Gemmatimonadota bacterium]